MNTLRFTLALALLALMGCAPSQYTKELDQYPNEYYYYSSVIYPLNYIYITKHRDDVAIVYVDEVVSRRVHHDPDHASPTLLSFDRPQNVVFYIPTGFNFEMKEWSYEECQFEVINYDYGSRPKANAIVYNYLIEQRCENDPKIVRFEYANYYGLQSFGVGKYKRMQDGEMVFELEDVYALYGAEIGFGVRR